ncbi:MAG: metallophosphoesterase family protein [Actinomycetota bacterium]|nr:metallophosphoesterase family protein [Actinomycetota bacterium]
MKILAIGDMHGNLEALKRVGGDVGLWKPDLVVFNGDIIPGDDREEEWSKAQEEGRHPDPERLAGYEERDRAIYRDFLEAMSGFQGTVRIIPGHVDAPYSLFLEELLKQRDRYPHVLPVHHSFINTGRDFVLVGFGGEITDGDRDDEVLIRFPIWELRYWLDALNHLSQEPVLLTHMPPLAERVDLRDGVHVGSAFLRELIEEFKPIYTFCGHAHAAQGMEEIGETLVINPGALAHGNYAILNTRKETVRFDAVEVD